MAAITQKPNAFSLIDVRQTTCSYLSPSELEIMSKVSRLWSLSVIDEEKMRLIRYVKTDAYGSQNWNKNLGKVDAVKLDLNIWRTLHRPCPFFPGKLVKETHTLFLMPKTVNKETLTLDSFKPLLRNNKSGVGTLGFNLIYLSGSYDAAFNSGDMASGPARDCLYSLNTDKGNSASFYILMPKQVVPGSKNLPFEEQIKLIPHDYIVPKIHEAVAGIFLHFMRTRQMILTKDRISDLTYTSCTGDFSFLTPLAIPTVGGFNFAKSRYLEIRSLPICNSPEFFGKPHTEGNMHTGISPIMRFEAPPVKNDTSCTIA